MQQRHVQTKDEYVASEYKIAMFLKKLLQG